MNEMGNSFHFVLGCVDVFKGVCGLIANSGKPNSADMQKIVEKTRAMKTDIFDRAEVDDIGGIGQKRIADILNKALIGDVEDVLAVDGGTDEADKEQNSAKQENNEEKNWTGGVGDMKKMVKKGGIGEKNRENNQEDECESFASPECDKRKTRTLNREDDFFAFFKFDGGERISHSTMRHQ